MRGTKKGQFFPQEELFILTTFQLPALLENPASPKKHQQTIVLSKPMFFDSMRFIQLIKKKKKHFHLNEPLNIVLLFSDAVTE